MKGYVFKIGDKVTPNPETDCSLRFHIGEIFTIINIRDGAIDVDRGTAQQSQFGWMPDVWILDKRSVIREIIKDL